MIVKCGLFCIHRPCIPGRKPSALPVVVPHRLIILLARNLTIFSISTLTMHAQPFRFGRHRATCRLSLRLHHRADRDMPPQSPLIQRGRSPLAPLRAILVLPPLRSLSVLGLPTRTGTSYRLPRSSTRFPPRQLQPPARMSAPRRIRRTRTRTRTRTFAGTPRACCLMIQRWTRESSVAMAKSSIRCRGTMLLRTLRRS
jgi:hypothetical protein